MYGKHGREDMKAATGSEWQIPKRRVRGRTAAV